jgi:AcrR family transcriptional regulator
MSERKTKELRREELLDAALEDFAELGLFGASTEEIARRAGISHPYVFRLFPTKKELFMAVAARCFRETLELFQQVAEGKRGREALSAIGEVQVNRLRTNPKLLRLQIQAFAACGDPDVREIVRNGLGDLVAYVERVGGLIDEEPSRFLAIAMLMNVLASLHLSDGAEPWVDRLLAGCRYTRETFARPT